MKELVNGQGELAQQVRFIVTGHGSASPAGAAAGLRAQQISRELQRLGVAETAIEMHTELRPELVTPRTELRVELARRASR